MVLRERIELCLRHINLLFINDLNRINILVCDIRMGIVCNGSKEFLETVQSSK